jgi:copper chaperone CopZ
MAEKISQGGVKRAVIDMTGANCAACAYTIEHLGRKVQGVRDLFVDAPSRQIHVTYEGNPGSLEKIAQIVRTIGYDASIRWDSIA